MTALSAGNKKDKIGPLQLIVVFAILQFVIAFFTDPMMLTFDESMWHYIGRNWIRSGLTPYSGGIDNKSPLIFYIFGVSDWFFGVNFWFPRMVGILVQSAGIFALFKIAEKIIGKGAGVIAISFYGLSLLWRSTGGKYVSYTETYAIAAVIISIYFCIVSERKNHALIGGLVAGLGFGFRITAIFGIVPIFIYLSKLNKKSALLYVAGFLIGIIILILLAAFAGIKISDFLFYGFTDNFGTGSPTDHTFGWSIKRLSDGFFYSEIILFYPAIVYYFILVRKFNFFTIWMISEFLGIVVLGLYDRSHYKNLLPVMSLMGAYSMHHLVTHYGLPAKQVLLGLWIVFFPKTFEPLFAIRKYLYLGNSQLSVSKETMLFEEERFKKLIGLWIKSKTNPDERVYVAGFNSQIQVYSERISPSIYFNATQTAFAKERLYSDLLKNKPALVVIPQFGNYYILIDKDIRHFISDMVAANYTLDTCLYNYNIFSNNKRKK